MNCAEISSLSPLYLSGELDPSRCAAVAKHVATCSSCALQLQMHADLDNLLRQAILSEQISTAALDRRIHERITAEAHQRPTRPLPHRSLFAVAAVILFLLVGGLGYRALFGKHTPAVYADAAADHHDEIIDQQPRKWISDPPAIASLAQKHGVSPSAIAALAPAGYHLECAKICDLNGQPYMHLVFVADSTDNPPAKDRKISLFICPRTAATLPQSSPTTQDGRVFYAPVIGPEHLACFETKEMTALVVTDQAGDAALNFARTAAGVF